MKSKIIYFFLLLIILSKAYIFASKYTTDINPQEYIVFIESLKEITKDKVSYNVRIGKNFKDKCILNIYKDKYSKEESLITDYFFILKIFMEQLICIQERM